VKIGLYFGSFNPVHVGHLIIVNHILNESELEMIWFIVSPLNPFKDSHNLMNEYDRLHLVNKAIEEYPRLKSRDIEYSKTNTYYTEHKIKK
jgi:nicotinate-nucleotide adenylyltransferase